ncbi:OmpP1/FadL family transporter [Zestomonas carbonaria]|uniref:Outer membrane protein P1 n=1 Tax=Zestomonas carbonaria TaxID=2762745 RepID=A0A7U7EQH0_9GAMM|nr:outer membrane protein transport protein [Pseudomonas carbonaria]CAD5109279.1 Outer membrane protein P1 [Pseudomonas carbonaria]
MKPFSTLIALPLLGIAAGVQAGGVSLYEVGQEDMGLANAGAAARAQDPSVLMSNPAGIANLEGTQINLAGQLVLGHLRFDRDGDNTTSGNEGGNALDALPGSSFFISHQLDDRATIGFGMYGNFGLALNYDDDWAGRYFVQDTALLGISFQPTFAYRFTDDLAVGIGPRLMYGVFRSEMAIDNNPLGFGDQPDGQLEYRSHDWGAGVNAGLLYSLSPGTRLGLAYTSKIDLQFEDRPSLDGIDNPILEVSLRRLAADQLSIDMRVPQSVIASLYHELNPEWTLLASAGWQDWSEFGKMSIDIDGQNPQGLTADRRYKDTWHLSLGAQRHLSPRLRWNMGLAYDSSAVDDEDRTVDNPMAETWRLATGFNYRLDEGLDLNVSYALVWLGDMEVDQQKRVSGKRVSGEYSNSALHILGGGVIWRF